MNAGFDAVTWCTRSTKRASRISGALVERVLADHVGRGQEEEVGLRVARVAHAALVRMDARGARADRRGDVGAQAVAIGAGELGHVVRTSLFVCPSQLTGHEVGLRTEAAEDAHLCSAIELRPKGDGIRTRNLRVKEGTPTYAAGRLDFQGAQLQRHRLGCEARARTWSSCFRGRRGAGSTTSHGSFGLDGEIRTPNLRLPTPARVHCASSSWY